MVRLTIESSADAMSEGSTMPSRMTLPTRCKRFKEPFIEEGKLRTSGNTGPESQRTVIT